MKRFAYGFVVLTALVLVGAFWLRMMVVKIAPGQVGVRQANMPIFGEQGVIKQDYDQPGWYRAIPVLDSWSIFDRTVQTLHMGHGWKGDAAKLELTSADGYRVSLDLTVKYRIKDGSAWQLLQVMGPGDAYKQKVENEAADRCRRVFGVISTEDFYSSGVRTEKTREVREGLREVMAPRHVEIIDVLIRDVAFDPQYEKKIKQKTLAEQDVELNKSKARAAEGRGRTGKLRAQIEAMVVEIDQQREFELTKRKASNDRTIAERKAQYQRYVTQRKAEADLTAAQLKAKGQLLVLEAQAEGERLRNEALAGPGGRVRVALEAARNLKVQSATFSTLEFDPTDLEATARRFGLK